MKFKCSAVGITTVNKLRSFAAAAVGSKAAGQCPTVLIWVTLGMHYDPLVKCIVDQIKMWFWLYEKAETIDKVDIHRAWVRAKADLLSRPTPSSGIIGPMGALITMLSEYGWNMISPTFWLDIDQAEYRYRGGSLTSILNEVRSRMSDIAWTAASLHHNGKGLEKGADLLPVNKHIDYMEKHDKHNLANLLITILAGGIWSGTRKAQANLPDATDKCPHCGQVQTDLHMFWTCPKLVESDNPSIISTQYLVPKATQHGEEVPCLWYRGLVPKMWTTPSSPPSESVHNICGVDPLSMFDPSQPIFLDGSGGPQSQDPRLRRVGWAWCQTFPVPLDQVRPGLPEDDIGQYGTMEGNQTVPRAELQALIFAVTFLGIAPGPCTIHIYSDNVAVVDGYNVGRRVGHGNMDDLWEPFWAIHSRVTSGGWIIKVHKVKAHTLDTPIKCDPEYGYDVMPHEIRIGNSRADFWADHAAEIASVYGRTPKPYGLIDALGWNVRKRLLAVCIEFIQKGKYQNVKNMRKF